MEGEDFTIILGKSSGGRPSKIYIVTLDIGKHLAMMERNNKGKEVRQHFIDVEKKYTTEIPDF